MSQSRPAAPVSRRSRIDPAVVAQAAAVRHLAAAALDWDSLAATIRSCTACHELAATRAHVVVGAAPVGARVLLLGEAPGATEDAAGEPFLGAAGRLLDQLLGEVGLDRRAVAVVNVLKCRPPGNRRPRPAEVMRCRGWTARQIALVAPRVAVALGSTAVQWWFGPDARIAALRGQPQPVGGVQVVATYHPSAAIRFGPAGAPLAALRTDLALAAALARSVDG